MDARQLNAWLREREMQKVREMRYYEAKSRQANFAAFGDTGIPRQD